MKIETGQKWKNQDGSYCTVVNVLPPYIRYKQGEKIMVSAIWFFLKENTKISLQYPEDGPEAHCDKCGMWIGTTHCSMCEPEKDWDHVPPEDPSEENRLAERMRDLALTMAFSGLMGGCIETEEATEFVCRELLRLADLV